MGPQVNVKGDITTLQHDVSRLLQDIGKLTAQSGSDARDAIEVGGDKLAASIKQQLGDLSTKVTKMSDTMKDYGAKADESIHSHPYAFAAGALGIGYLLGKIPLRKSPSTN
jgi:ElaB/YqjD/DUF883 family membrane-anchored ribosome-binding protein